MSRFRKTTPFDTSQFAIAIFNKRKDGSASVESFFFKGISTSDKKNFAQIQYKSAQKFLEKHDIYPDSINHSVVNSSSSGSVICISSCSDKSFIGSDALANNDITAEQLAISSSKKFLFDYQD